MKRIFKLLAGFTTLAGTGIMALRKFRTKRKLKEIADNGYETAVDILFPGGDLKSKKLHYGPVLPG